MKKLVAANWKMNGSAALVAELSESIISQISTLKAPPEVLIFPPAPFFYVLKAALAGQGVGIGGQDCHAQAAGAFTGDISAAMLKEAGCSHVILGHSERRQHHGETDASVRGKAERAILEGLTPIICIGESLSQREAGAAYDTVSAQLSGSLPQGKDGHFVLAYEPIWAIGTGRTPTPDDIARMHAHIIERAGPGARALYGGSVTGENAAEIVKIPGVGGVLVGGASLKAQAFTAILRAAAG